MSASLRRQTVILVAEDNLLLRFMTADSMREAGYDVVEVGTAEEALAVFDAGTTVDLVFSEIHFPGSMNGFDLWRWLSNHHPGVPLILSSGYGDAAAAKNTTATFLPKPYSMAEVLLRIRSLLKEQSKGTALSEKAVRPGPFPAPDSELQPPPGAG